MLKYWHWVQYCCENVKYRKKGNRLKPMIRMNLFYNIIMCIRSVSGVFVLKSNIRMVYAIIF